MLAILEFISIFSLLALHSLEAAARCTDRCVVHHFIFGNTIEFKEKDWDDTFDLASKAKIDAFVFNIGQDSWMEGQMDAAFKAAPKYTTEICFSFDFAAAPWDTNSIIAFLKKYVTRPGHFKYNGTIGGGKYLVSTFYGDKQKEVDWPAVKRAVPNIFIVPHLHPDTLKENPLGIDGALNWNAWATQNNKPIDGNASTFDDHTMQRMLNAKQAYATLVSPWSFTNYQLGGLIKHWIFKSDELLVFRWNQMLKFAESEKGAHIDIIELYSWNDYGESNYQNNISNAYDNEFSGGADGWCKGFKHDGWRLLNIPFINAFKARDRAVAVKHIDEELVVFHHRPYPAATSCAGQTEAIPGSEIVPDQVTITSLLKFPVELVIKSGDITTNAQAPAGVSINRAAMHVGRQSVMVMRNGKKCGEMISEVEVKGSCTIINYNANVETIHLNCPAS